MASLFGIRKSATTDAASGLFTMRDVEQNKHSSLSEFRPIIYSINEQRKSIVDNKWGPHINTSPSGSPTISGTATQGQTLTAVTSGISDADGLGSFSYQWLRGGSTISGATNSTYVLISSDVGSTVSVRVSYTDNYGTAETLTSSATSTVQSNIKDWSDAGTIYSFYNYNTHNIGYDPANGGGFSMDATADRIVISNPHNSAVLNSDGSLGAYRLRVGGFWVMKRNGTSWGVEYGNSGTEGTRHRNAWGGAMINADGNRIVAASVGTVGTSIGSGIYVYNRSGTSWSKTTLSNDSQFTVIISGDGNTIVGTRQSSNGNSSSSNNTSAKVWKYSSGSWGSPTTISQSTQSFGYDNIKAINYDGTVLAIGCPNNSQIPYYQWTGSAWQGMGSLGANNATSIRISKDGRTLAFGFNSTNTNTGGNGSVNIYKRSTSNAGTYFSSSSLLVNGSSNEGLKVMDISDDGNIVVMGAPYKDGYAADFGEVRVAQYDGTSWTQTTLTASTGLYTSDRIGFMGGISKASGEFIVAPRSDGNLTTWTT